MKKRLHVFLIIISLIIVCIPEIVFGQTVADRDVKIQKDLDIFNNILNKLIINDSPFYFSFDDRVKGVYLDGFGMLFDLESFGLYNLSESVYKTIKNIEIIDNKRDTVIKVQTDRKERKDESKSSVDEPKSIAGKVGQTKKLLAQFYRDYASAVKSLNPEERIVVNIRIRENDPGQFVGKTKEKSPTQLRSSLQVADLIQFRQGKLTEEQLLKKIQFTESYDAQDDHEIEIMENIMNTALGKSSSKSALTLSGSTRGIYLDNFGVLFFSPASVFDKSMKILIKNLSQWEKQTREFEQKTREFERQTREFESKTREFEKNRDKVMSKTPEAPEAPEAPELPGLPDEAIKMDIVSDRQGLLGQNKAEIDSIINSMSDQIIELLGQYGHTMRKVKDNEWIMVAIDFNNKLWNTDESRLYIKVKKADLLKYNRDEINMDTLKKSVKIWRS